MHPEQFFTVYVLQLREREERLRHLLAAQELGTARPSPRAASLAAAVRSFAQRRRQTSLAATGMQCCAG